MAEVFAGGGKLAGPSEAEVKAMHVKIGWLAVENDLLSAGQKWLAKIEKAA